MNSNLKTRIYLRKVFYFLSLYNVKIFLSYICHTAIHMCTISKINFKGIKTSKYVKVIQQTTIICRSILDE